MACVTFTFKIFRNYKEYTKNVNGTFCNLFKN